MTEVVEKYIAAFRAKLDSGRAYEALVNSCGQSDLQQAARSVSEIADGLDEEAVKTAFVEYLQSDADACAIVEKFHGTCLDALDRFDSPLAVELKTAARLMLESEFAVYQAHRRLLCAAFADEQVLEELQENEQMWDLLTSGDGFALHEELAFNPIWSELFPSA